jgi:hypothetical protein
MRAQFINGMLTETQVSTWTNESQSPRDSSDFAALTFQLPNIPTAFIATGVATSGTSAWLSELLDGNVTSGRINGH